MRMRVCDLTTLYIDGGEGGVNTYLLEKARYFSSLREVESHTIIVPGERDEKLELHGSTVWKIRSPRLPSSPGPESRVLVSFDRIRRILREESPSVVEVDNAYFLGRVASGALRSRNVPVVGFYHVHLPTMARLATARAGSVLPRVLEHFTWRYVRLCSRWLDRLMVSTPEMHESLSVRGFRGLEYVPLGVNLDIFRPNGNARSERPTVILTVGRLSPEKNFEDLIDAFKLLGERGDYRLQVVGDGPWRGRLERRAGGDERIQFLGLYPHGEELAQLYAAADVFALPCTNECFGLAILEALASGLPVVAVKQGGPVHLVVPGVGALAEPGNAADLAAKIEAVSKARCRSEPERELALACRLHAETNYSWEKTFDRVLDVYDRARFERGHAVSRKPRVPERPEADILAYPGATQVAAEGKDEKVVSHHAG
ncbi:glycosyltransferase [bacterium]|nr:glycosyltransferase [bacterium]